MGKEDLIDAARLGNYPICEKILSNKPKRPGPFARWDINICNYFVLLHSYKDFPEGIYIANISQGCLG